MRVAITGATGLVGTALASRLRTAGHDVVGIARHEAPGICKWDPARREIDIARLDGIDAVVHLAGENLADGRWTAARKALLRESRVATTSWFSTLLAGLARPPAVLVTASAVGIYGDRGDEVLEESAAPGSDFLAQLCIDWEAAAAPARTAGIRVVHPRFGIILSPQGGALARLLVPFRLGVGGPLGSGRQWMSWIAIDDVADGLVHALTAESMRGPVNFTAPAPVRNREFARCLGRALHRPALLRVPAAALRLALGELADGALLASQLAIPAALAAGGFTPRFPDLDAALDHLLTAS